MESLHPMFVHFPIVLLIAAFLIETAALLFRKPEWSRISFWHLLFGALAALAAVCTGRLAMGIAKHSYQIYPVMEWHERIGYGVAALALTAVVLRFKSRDAASVRYRLAAWILLAVACGAMAFGAHLGGRLVYEFGVGGSYGRSAGIMVQ